MMALGRHVRALGLRDACAMALKKNISRLLSRERMVSRDDDTQDFPCMRHWQGGGPTTMSRQKPLSGALKEKTPAQDMEVMRHLSGRDDAGDSARVLSTRGRTTARGTRWQQTRVAYPRKP
jgi:hypothetical protein